MGKGWGGRSGFRVGIGSASPSSPPFLNRWPDAGLSLQLAKAALEIARPRCFGLAQAKSSVPLTCWRWHFVGKELGGALRLAQGERDALTLCSCVFLGVHPDLASGSKVELGEETLGGRGKLWGRSPTRRAGGRGGAAEAARPAVGPLQVSGEGSPRCVPGQRPGEAQGGARARLNAGLSSQNPPHHSQLPTAPACRRCTVVAGVRAGEGWSSEVPGSKRCQFCKERTVRARAVPSPAPTRPGPPARPALLPAPLRAEPLAGPAAGPAPAPWGCPPRPCAALRSPRPPSFQPAAPPGLRALVRLRGLKESGGKSWS